jgi:RHS repeat-associated protein
MTGGSFHIKPADLHTSGSTLQSFSEDIASGGDKLQTVSQRLVAHAGSDKSGVGAVIVKALGKGADVAGKVFSEGGRVVGGAGGRLHSNATAHEENETRQEGVFRGIHPDKPGSGSSPKSSTNGDGGSKPKDSSGSGGPKSAAKPPKPHGEGSGKDPKDESSSPPDRTAGGDPVDLVTGEMFMDQEDLALPGVLPLVFERTHVSGYRAGRWFGGEWSSTLDQHVRVDADAVHCFGADGVVLHYPIPAATDELVMPSQGARWPLRWNRETDTILVGRPESGLTFAFPAAVDGGIRPLATVTDRHGNGMVFHRDADGAPVELRHSGGYHVRFGRVDTAAGSRVADLRMVRDDGAELTAVSFGYDARGRLDRVADSKERPLLFEYDDDDRVIAWTDRVGQTYRYVFDESGRVVRTEGTGDVLTASFRYDLDARVTTLTDSLGHETRYHWNEFNQITKVVDPLGGETLSEYSRFGLPLSKTDPTGQTVTTRPAETGRILRETAPDGTAREVEYDDELRPTRITGPDRTVWTLAYDGGGNLLAEHGPGGTARSYAYDESGAVAAVTDELGQTTRFVNNTAGLPIAVIEPSGATTRYERDPFGRIVAEEDSLGDVVRMGWTVEGHPAWRIDADGAREEWEHDAEGNMLLHRGPTGGETRFEYGPFGEITARVDPTGTRYDYAYDTELRLRNVTGPTGLTWEYKYDAAGNVVLEKDFDGVTRTSEYDAASRLVRRVNGVGQWVDYRYDELGRLAERRTEHAVHTHTYDEAGRILAVRGPGHVLEYTYDEAGRAVTETLNGRATAYTYDPAGRVLSRKTPSGAVSAWAYDAEGEPTTLTAAGGALAFERDAAGRETARRFGAGIIVRQGFDPVGRLAQQAVQSAPSGGVEHVTTLQQRSFTYRVDGNPVQIADRIHGTRNYELDEAGRVTAVRAAGWTETYGYDRNGNLVHAETPAGKGPAQRRVTGNLVHEAGDLVFEHDDQGRVVLATRRTAAGVLEWTYTWDAEDQLVAARTPDGSTWHYLYDAFGRRIAKRCLDRQGRTVTETWFTWEGTRLAEQVVSGGSHSDVTTWDWEPGTHRALAQSRRSARLDSDQVDVAFHAIVTDLVGTPTELVAPDGRIAWHATEVWGTGVNRTVGEADFPLRFPGQYHDTETGLHYNLHRYYNPSTAAYLSPDPMGLNPSPNNHAYVDNPLTYLDPLGLMPTCLKGIKQKLKNLNPFKKKQQGPTGPPQHVYRWDNRKPEDVSANGLAPWDPNGNVSLADHVERPGKNGKSQWVSTSDWAGTGNHIGFSKSHFYKIDTSKLPDPSRLADVNKTLGDHTWTEQKEWAHNGTVPADAITGWATGREGQDVVFGNPPKPNSPPPNDGGVPWKPLPATGSTSSAGPSSSTDADAITPVPA